MSRFIICDIYLLDSNSRFHVICIYVPANNAFKDDFSVIQTEAFDMRKASKVVGFLNLNNIHIEGDNITIINFLLKIWKPRSTNALIADAGLDLTRFSGISIAHCFRKANQTTNLIAHKGQGANNLIHKFPPYSFNFSLIIRKDVLG